MKQFTDEDVTRIIRSKLGFLYSKGYTKYEISIQLDVSEKTLYKWEHGMIPKTLYYLNLLRLCEKAWFSKF